MQSSWLKIAQDHQKVGSIIIARRQCDQKKIAKCLQKLPKNDFTRKMIYFDTFKNCLRMCQIFVKLIAAKGFKKLPKVQ